jgi:hypothetical protein
MPPSVDYLLWIALAAARVTGKQMTMKNTPTLLAILMAMAMHQYVTMHIAQSRRSRASLEATGYRHWASIHSNSSEGTYLRHFCVLFFIANTLKMGAKQMDGP